VIPAVRLARPRRWPGVVAWTLWVLAVVAAPAVVWLDHLLRQAGRPDLTQLAVVPVLALVSAATVGAVLASRRPAHPVGWLLLAQVVSLLATGAAAQYLAWGLLVGPATLPATRYAALYYPATAVTGLTVLGFVLLLTPTGSLPSPRWRWWARAMVAVPVVLLLVVTLAPGSVDPYYQVVGSPFDFHGLSGVLLVANQLALAVTPGQHGRIRCGLAAHGSFPDRSQGVVNSLYEVSIRYAPRRAGPGREDDQLIDRSHWHLGPLPTILMAAVLWQRRPLTTTARGARS
jgi:hypothetical protein